MVRRLTARQVLRYLQDIEPDCSDRELSESEDPRANDAFPCTLASDAELIHDDSRDENSKDDDAVIDSGDSDDEMQNLVGKDVFMAEVIYLSSAERRVAATKRRKRQA